MTNFEAIKKQYTDNLDIETLAEMLDEDSLKGFTLCSMCSNGNPQYGNKVCQEETCFFVDHPEWIVDYLKEEHDGFDFEEFLKAKIADSEMESMI